MVHLHKNTFPFCHLNLSQVSKWFETFFSGIHYVLQFIPEMFSEVKNRTLCCPCSNQDCFVIVHVNKGQHTGIGRGSLFRISQCDSIVILPRTTRGASSCHEKQPHITSAPSPNFTEDAVHTDVNCVCAVHQLKVFLRLLSAPYQSILLKVCKTPLNTQVH